MSIIIKNNSVNDALRLFDKIMIETKIKGYNIAGAGNSVTLGHLNSENGILPKLMIRSDEISVALNGMRLWNSYYKGSTGTLFGYSVHDADSDLKIDSYEKYPCSDIDDIPFALRFLICSYALNETLKIDRENKLITVEKQIGYFSDSKIKNNEIMEFSTEDEILSYLAQKTICNESQNIKKVLLEISNSNDFNAV